MESDLILAPSKDDQNWGVLMHLSLLSTYVLPGIGFVVPIILWVLKRGQSVYLDQEGKEVLNFMITLVLMAIVCWILAFVVIGFALMWLLGIWSVILPVIAAVKTSQGKEVYRYPFVVRLLQ